MTAPPHDAEAERRAEMLARVAVLYERLLSEHGVNHQGIGWSDSPMMTVPYQLFGELIGDDPGPYTVNDLGCGYGGFFEYLAALPSFAEGRYIGYDISDAMVWAARRRITDPRARFYESALPLARADYTVASGIFSIRFEADRDAWERHVQDTVLHMADACHKGFAFNLLGLHPPDPEADLYYADPAVYAALCSELGTVRAVEYLHNQWMFLVRRDRS